MNGLKESQVQHAMSFDLLRHVRDTAPPEDELLRWAEEHRLSGNYHVLRKAGVLHVSEGRVVITQDLYTSDRKGVHFGNSLYWLDTERKDVF